MQTPHHLARMQPTTTLPLDNALVALWAHTDDLGPEDRRRFMDLLAGALSAQVGREEWARALETARTLMTAAQR